MRIFDADSIDWGECPFFRDEIGGWVLKQHPIVSGEKDGELTTVVKTYSSLVVMIYDNLKELSRGFKLIIRLLVITIVCSTVSVAVGLTQLLLLLLK